MNLIKISKATLNPNVAIVDFRDLFTAGAVRTKEVRVLLPVGEIRHDGRTLTIVHPAGEYTFKPDQVDDIGGNIWVNPETPWDFDTFYNHILVFLGWN